MNTKLGTNQTTSKLRRASIIALGLAASLLASNPTVAASACKGLENSACNTNASCGWVEGYQRKDGRSVKSFCRAKPVSNKSLAKKSVAKSKPVSETVASN